MARLVIALIFVTIVSCSLYGEDSYLDVPVFPGAKAEETLNSADDENIQIGVQTFSTTAPFDEVVAFYKEKLPSAMFTTMDSEGEKMAVFNVFESDGAKTVSVTQMEGAESTDIGIVKQSF